MAQRPYSRYTREHTWAALYSQNINACYALVPNSATNNSIEVIRCKDAKETQEMMAELLNHASECETFYAEKEKHLEEEKQKAKEELTTELVTPPFLVKARMAVVLAKSSDYYRYHLADETRIKLVICGLHDSYLHLPVWEMRTNRRYSARETAVEITAPSFDRIRKTQFGHTILIGAVVCGDKAAIAFKDALKDARTRRRINVEVDRIQHEKRYQGRPLAFLAEEKRQEIGKKISDSLKRYHRQKHS
jgi:hypothetical protein